MIFGKLIGQTPLGAGAQALTNLYNALPSATPLSDNEFPSVQQLHTRVTVLTATGAGTNGQTVTIGGIMGIVGTDFVGGGSAVDFIAIIVAWAQANFAAIGQITAASQIVDNLDGTMTITWDAGAAANALACTTDDLALSFANTVTGSDNTLVRSPLTAITGYLEYTALLTQTGTAAPVATVLANTLGGTVVWTRSVVGVYVATLNAAFPLNRTTLMIAPVDSLAGGDIQQINGVRVTRNNDGTLTVNTGYHYWNVTDLGTMDADGILNNTCIQVRVYPA